MELFTFIHIKVVNPFYLVGWEIFWSYVSHHAVFCSNCQTEFANCKINRQLVSMFHSAPNKQVKAVLFVARKSLLKIALPEL